MSVDSELLKGNFDVKNPIAQQSDKSSQSQAESITEALKKEAINSIGGSMVYMERSELNWDGDEE